MMKTGRRKTVYILAALIVLAAGVALVGNTLANGVTRNEAQQAISNDYNVLFQYKNQQEIYEDVPADALAKGAKAITDGMFWCPGRTEIIYLKLDNQELFDVEGTLSVNVYGSNLGDTLTYAVIHGDTASHPGNWNDFLAKAIVSGTSGTMKAGTDQNPKNYILLSQQQLNMQAGTDESANDYYVALAIHMDENASNQYQNNSVKLDLKLQIDANFKPGVNPNDFKAGDQST